ncbi:Uma2 family endonuclease [Paludisphaera mucosa]|uniref:Uma2 family endonuclease n=1 Tax=Paludisphaera mucosa TaxID=3030827 RepID=A0ABT6F896_9BACT|nr:Uma2 family endonuclease [Paludisphaera mucosa]MDG3003785.1 Uma2 family endonuclease [Paludisphaera mucosa]
MATVGRSRCLPVPAAEDIYRIPVELYERLVELAELDEDDRIELLNGMLVRKMTKNPPHQVCCELCRDEIARILPAGFTVRSEGPVRIPDYSEPEPDLAVVRGRTRDYVDRHPEPADVALLVEVADSSLARDRGEKRDIYARAGIPIYWVVDLTARCVEVYTGPRDGAYASTLVIAEDAAIDVVVEGEPWGRLVVAAILP